MLAGYEKVENSSSWSRIAWADDGYSLRCLILSDPILHSLHRCVSLTSPQATDVEEYMTAVSDSRVVWPFSVA